MTKSVMIGIVLLLLVPAFPLRVAALPLSADEIREAGLQPLREATASVDFQLQDLAGADRRLSDFRGKVVFLNFWATWCGPCRVEMPSMEKVYRRLKARGLEIVAVNLQEDRRTVQRFVKEQDLSFTVLLDSDGRVGSTYGARSIPTTYIIDRQGNVVAGTIGTREWDSEEMIRLFSRLLD